MTKLCTIGGPIKEVSAELQSHLYRELMSFVENSEEASTWYKQRRMFIIEVEEVRYGLVVDFDEVGHFRIMAFYEL
jgi:hypothetical protein